MHWNPFTKPAPVVPLVRLEGQIAPKSQFGRTLSIDAVGKLLDKAFATGGAKAVAIALNSPGGSPVQSNLIFQRIRELSGQHELPVLVFCEDVAASGGYWIALAGDEIFVDPASIIGSIGVISASFGFQELIARHGVERRMHTSGEDKSFLDPFLPEKEKDVARLKHLQAGMHEQFIDLVKQRRGGKLKPGADLFNGDFWLGREAIELGLADAIGTPERVLRKRYGDEVNIKRIGGPKRGLLGRLMGGGADAMMDAVAARLAWARFGL